tara:strand:+ start:1628 stop:1837 length:210 start_codon:yes stop_codon:yes gene_type:complete
MEQQISNQEILEKLNQMQQDIDILKEKLDDEGELTDWAKEELEKARQEPLGDQTSLEDLRKELENEISS